MVNASKSTNIEWFYIKGQSIFTKKSFIMHLGRNNPRYIYYIDNDPLQSVEEYKDLGVIMDSNLKFHTHTHTSAVASKTNQVLGLIRKSLQT